MRSTIPLRAHQDAWRRPPYHYSDNCNLCVPAMNGREKVPCRRRKAGFRSAAGRRRPRQAPRSDRPGRSACPVLLTRVYDGGRVRVRAYVRGRPRASEGAACTPPIIRAAAASARRSGALPVHLLPLARLRRFHSMTCREPLTAQPPTQTDGQFNSIGRPKDKRIFTSRIPGTF